MSKTAIGLVLCGASRFTAKERERIAEKFKPCLFEEGSFGASSLAALALKTARRGFSRVLVAGASPAGQGELLQAFAAQSGLPTASVAGADLAPALASRNRAAEAIRAIQKGLAALAEIPPIERRRLPLAKEVLVVGGGAAGLQAASALSSLGHLVTIVEKTDGSGALRQAFSLKGATLLAGSQVRQVEGQLGGFTVSVRTPQGDKRVSCGAVVLASGIQPPAAIPPFDLPAVVPAGELEAALARLPRRRGGRPVALILDWKVDETKASSQEALQLALKLQQGGSTQVHLFCRDVRVGAMELEELYDAARQAGVDIVKFEGELKLSAAGGGVSIAWQDPILGGPVSLECELAGVSAYGVESRADPELARLFGVTLDPLGQMQANNIHLFPGETNRPGIFAAGACRGQPYLPALTAEAQAVHQLLAPGALEVELAQPVVDADKCALCLTCVRSCPHGAMYVDRTKGAAASSPEACRRCGICAGECPAKAIELPAWSDRVVMSQVG
jgi:heterodisulfide reductase subunit A-like polyferredoxin